LFLFLLFICDAFSKKSPQNLHMSKKSCTFAPEFFKHLIYYAYEKYIFGDAYCMDDVLCVNFMPQRFLAC